MGGGAPRIATRTISFVTRRHLQLWGGQALEMGTGKEIGKGIQGGLTKFTISIFVLSLLLAWRFWGGVGGGEREEPCHYEYLPSSSLLPSWD